MIGASPSPTGNPHALFTDAMASPLPTAKQSVSLASAGPRGSKIRRDPPPVAKELAVSDPDKRDARTVVFGILTFTLALVVIMIALASYSGWSPRDYVAHF